MVLDLVLGRLGDDHALGIEARTPRAPRDLVELARAQTAHFVAVELRERGEHNGVDGHVDAHAERVGSADDGENALLGELFHQQAITGQHSCVMHADAAAEQAFQRLAERRGESRALHGLLHRLALLLRRHAIARQRRRARERHVLRKVDDVERTLPFSQRELDGALKRRERVLVGKRHRARRVDNAGDVLARLALEQPCNLVNVAKCGAHQQKLHIGKRKQRYLPSPTAIGVGEKVELVHGDALYGGVLSLGERLIREDLLRAADDRGRRVDVHISRDHAHVLAA